MDREAVVVEVGDGEEDWEGWLDREPSIDWTPYIHRDSRILGGKPVVQGTRLSVEFILDLYAAGWTDRMVLENYQRLTPEAVRAVFAFAADLARQDYEGWRSGERR